MIIKSKGLRGKLPQIDGITYSIKESGGAVEYTIDTAQNPIQFGPIVVDALDGTCYLTHDPDVDSISVGNIVDILSAIEINLDLETAIKAIEKFRLDLSFDIFKSSKLKSVIAQKILANETGKSDVSERLFDYLLKLNNQAGAINDCFGDDIYIPGVSTIVEVSSGNNVSSREGILYLSLYNKFSKEIPTGYLSKSDVRTLQMISVTDLVDTLSPDTTFVYDNDLQLSLSRAGLVDLVDKKTISALKSATKALSRKTYLDSIATRYSISGNKLGSDSVSIYTRQLNLFRSITKRFSKDLAG